MIVAKCAPRECGITSGADQPKALPTEDTSLRVERSVPGANRSRYTVLKPASCEIDRVPTLMSVADALTHRVEYTAAQFEEVKTLVDLMAERSDLSPAERDTLTAFQADLRQTVREDRRRATGAARLPVSAS